MNWIDKAESKVTQLLEGKPYVLSQLVGLCLLFIMGIIGILIYLTYGLYMAVTGHGDGGD